MFLFLQLFLLGFVAAKSCLSQTGENCGRGRTITSLGREREEGRRIEIEQEKETRKCPAVYLCCFWIGFSLIIPHTCFSIFSASPPLLSPAFSLHFLPIFLISSQSSS